MLTRRRRPPEPVRSDPRARLAGAPRTDRTSPAGATLTDPSDTTSANPPADPSDTLNLDRWGDAHEDTQSEQDLPVPARGPLGRWRARRATRSPVMAASPFPSVAAKAVPLLAALALAAGVAAFVQLRVDGARVRPVPVAAPAPAGPRLDQSSLAADAALRVVAAWGSATEASSDAMKQLGLQLPFTPRTGLGLKGLQVAAVTSSTTQPTVFRVLIAATSTSSAGNRLYFAVPVQTDGTFTTVLALPTPAPEPPITAGARLGYLTGDVAATSPLTATLTGFLGAYLAGEDVTRYTAPGSALSPVTGSGLPLERILRLDATVERDIAEAPVPPEAARTAVLVTFTAKAGSGPVTSQMALQLQARAGRWEVAQVDPVPVLAAPAAPGTDPQSSSLGAESSTPSGLAGSPDPSSPGGTPPVSQSNP